MKVFWTDAAIAQLQLIYNYVAETSPEYAQRIVDQLTRRSIQIAALKRQEVDHENQANRVWQ